MQAVERHVMRDAATFEKRPGEAGPMARPPSSVSLVSGTLWLWFSIRVLASNHGCHCVRCELTGISLPSAFILPLTLTRHSHALYTASSLPLDMLSLYIYRRVFSPLSVCSIRRALNTRTTVER